MVVRRLTRGDEALLAAVLGEFRNVVPEDPASFLGDPRCQVWVVEAEGATVGWCWAHELGRPDGRRDLLVYELEVVEAARRRGHGRALLDTVLREAEAAGYGKLWLLTDSDNTAAQALYAGAGGDARTQVLYSWSPVTGRSSGPVAK